MRITSEWVKNDATRKVFDALSAGGFEGFFVGGCVRNALLDEPVGDIDIATAATPDQVIEAAKSAGLKSIPTGYDHGTITVICHGTPYEITTFRKDTETDGRHATVAFGKDITEDASRRDFTINALYANAEGTVIDPLNGLPDLSERCVRFIGDADARIREDYLRILRFFRFHAWYGNQGAGLDAEGLAACAANLDGLGSLSIERLGAEMKKLLSAPDPTMAVAAMAASGVLSTILPGSDHRSLGPVVHLEKSKPNAILRLASLGVADAPDLLRLSNAEAKQFRSVRAGAFSDESPVILAYQFGADVAQDACVLRFALLGNELPENLETEIARGAAATFPIKAADIPQYSGKALGDKLRALETRWIASDFSLSTSQLLAE